MGVFAKEEIATEDREVAEKDAAKDVVIEDFSEPLEDEQKEKCTLFYEDRVDEEERHRVESDRNET